MISGHPTDPSKRSTVGSNTYGVKHWDSRIRATTSGDHWRSQEHCRTRSTHSKSERALKRRPWTPPLGFEHQKTGEDLATSHDGNRRPKTGLPRNLYNLTVNTNNTSSSTTRISPRPPTSTMEPQPTYYSTNTKSPTSQGHTLAPRGYQPTEPEEGFEQDSVR